MTQSQHRYSPAAVIAVEREAVYGVAAQISTSYVERSHLTLRQSCKRFVRLGTAFPRSSKTTRRP
jgi:IS1 family transposase